MHTEPAGEAEMPDALGASRRFGGSVVAPLCAAAAVALACLVVAHTRGLNGPWYWKWTWFVLPARRWYPWMVLAAVPAAAAVAIDSAGRRAGYRATALTLLAASVALMKITSASCVFPRFTLAHIGRIVFDFQSTSYYTDAGAIASLYKGWSWLADYPQILPTLNLHSLSKPPGPMAYYMLFIRQMGYGQRSATAAGVVLALLAAMSVPGTYWLLKTLTRSGAVALAGATMLTLCPGFVLVYPSFDAMYVGLAAVMLATWHLALRREGGRGILWAVAAGVAASVMFFMSYAPAVLGFFMIGDAVLAGIDGTRRAGAARSRWRATGAVAARALAAMAACGAVYLVLFITTGFDPIQTFLVASYNQQVLVLHHPGDRPYPWTILFDLTDFIFSAGWLVLVPAVLLLIRRPAAGRLVLLAVAELVVVAVSGQLQSETARVWNFMLPMLLLPAAMEVSGWRPWAQRLFYAGMLLVLLVVGQNMIFLGPPPPI